MKDVMILLGAGQIGTAIARRLGSNKKIIIGDANVQHATDSTKEFQEAGFDAVAVQADLGSKQSIQELIKLAQSYGEIKMLVNAAGVSPSQASIEDILKVDLYGTAVLMEEVGKVIAPGGTAVMISSQSGHRMPALTPDKDIRLAITPTEKILQLDMLQPENVEDTLRAYQLAKRCNELRVMAESVKWGERDARINAIAPGIIVTPLALDEFNGPRGDFYKNMFAKSPAGRPGTVDEIANVAQLLMTEAGSFITGSTILADGGATASYFFGPLQPSNN
ncbi:SDR family oxidoreductase [Secundilactobacillus kimchicus]|uniref:SDR family oxidoreductase n=1 Tax=Secundilactobacillus kimchicus TaxID=528209 RepID=UPI0024A7DED6|nr:SDR family oxidoreductase [Secundilactobacillus kimchicus]